jgi:TP901 family phage tail tape measure protein
MERYAKTVSTWTAKLKTGEAKQGAVTRAIKAAAIIYKAAKVDMDRLAASTAKKTAADAAASASAAKHAAIQTKATFAIQMHTARLAEQKARLLEVGAAAKLKAAATAKAAIADKVAAVAAAQAATATHAAAQAARTHVVALRLLKASAVSTSVAVKGLAASFGLLGPLVAVFAGFRVLKNVEEFNQGMATSLAIVKDVSEGTRAIMVKTAHDVARVTKASSAEAAKAYFFLESAGLSVQQSIASLPFVAKFATAGMFDMSRATDLLTDAQSALGKSFKDPIKNLKEMTKIGDALVKTNTLANATVEQLSESLTTKAAAAMVALNIPMEEGLAILATFADKGIKGAEAGTAFGIVMRDLTTKSIKFKDVFEKLGIETAFDDKGRFRGPIESIASLEKGLAGMSDEMKKATLIQLGFADKSLSFQLALIGSMEKARELREGIEDFGDTVERVSAKQMTPFSVGWERLSASFAEFSTDKASSSMESFGSVLEGVAVIFENLNWVLDNVKAGFAELLKMMVTVLRLTPGGRMLETAGVDFEGFQQGLQNIIDQAADRLGPGNAAPPVVPEFGNLSEAGIKALNKLNNTLRDSGKQGKFISAAFEEEKKAADRAAKTAQRIEDGLIKGFKDGIKTPMERFAETAELINGFLVGGKLTAEEAAKSIDVARETAVAALMSGLKKDQTKDTNGNFEFGDANVQGSAAAYAAIIRSQFPQTDPAQQEQEKQTNFLDNINRKLDVALRKVQPNQPVAIPPAA